MYVKPFRYQSKNKLLCIDKLKEIISDVSVIPVERITVFGIIIYN